MWIWTPQRNDSCLFNTMKISRSHSYFKGMKIIFVGWRAFLILPKCLLVGYFSLNSFCKKKNQNIGTMDSRDRQLKMSRGFNCIIFTIRTKLACSIPHTDFLQGTGENLCHGWVTLLQQLVGNGAEFLQVLFLLFQAVVKILPKERVPQWQTATKFYKQVWKSLASWVCTCWSTVSKKSHSNWAFLC